MERELARAKISANRVASVVANDWKDANDKVMPVKQWLEERRFMQVMKYALTSWLRAIFWSEQSCSIQLISIFLIGDVHCHPVVLAVFIELLNLLNLFSSCVLILCTFLLICQCRVRCSNFETSWFLLRKLPRMNRN